MSDEQIQCSDCGNAFVFTDTERAFYDSKGLSSPPKRCAPCRKARKLANPDRRPGPGGGGSGPPRGRNGAGAERSDRGGWGGGGGGGSMGGARGGSRAPAEGRGWGKPSFSRGPADRPQAAPFRGPADRPQGAPFRDPADRPQGAAFRGPADRPGGAPFQAGARARGARFGEDPVRQAPARPSAPVAAKPAQPAPRATRPKFDITCGSCGTPAQVPFRPLEGRDVFCQNCYRARRGIPAAERGGVVADALATGGLVASELVSGDLGTDESERTPD